MAESAGGRAPKRRPSSACRYTLPFNKLPPSCSSNHPSSFPPLDPDPPAARSRCGFAAKNGRSRPRSPRRKPASPIPPGSRGSSTARSARRGAGACRARRGVPGDPLTYYAATASGGVWKSRTAALTWKPVFDDQPISSIGSIAVAPSDPNVVYVGSGEANIRGNVAPGNGIYKSIGRGQDLDARLEAGGADRRRWPCIRRIPTSPSRPCSAMPSAPTPSAASTAPRTAARPGSRSSRRTRTPAPRTWPSIPSNPNVVFAGLWQARRRPWEMTSGGPGSGLYVSRDGGDTWKQLTQASGLPEGTGARSAWPWRRPTAGASTR